jgi:hypothetical protein
MGAVRATGADLKAGADRAAGAGLAAGVDFFCCVDCAAASVLESIAPKAARLTIVRTANPSLLTMIPAPIDYCCCTLIFKIDTLLPYPVKSPTRMITINIRGMNFGDVALLHRLDWEGQY